MARTNLTALRLRELLHYNAESGVFTWASRAAYCVKIGDPAGTIDSRGYMSIRVCGQAYRSHRLAWLHYYGEWPSHQIDHINGIRDDNRIANLRDVNNSLNGQNKRSATKHNKLGILGVKRIGRRFAAGININGSDIRLGMFETAELAHAAYLSAKRIHHKGCTI